MAMRPRETIEKLDYELTNASDTMESLILEVMLDIRDLLQSGERSECKTCGCSEPIHQTKR